jgi:hypothetical protein
MDGTGPRDLPSLWASPEWRAELEAWFLPALADAGLEVTGAVVQDRIRFWSTVLHVETDAGRVWVKENAPSQAFEAGLVTTVERLAPGRTAPVVAAETGRGWLATRDAGAPLGTRPDVADEAWVEMVAAWAGVQRDLEGHRDDVLATGVDIFPDDAAGWAAALADDLAALPAGDPRALSDAERRHVEAGLPLVAAAAEELVASGLPCSLQHNDLHLGNAVHAPGSPMQFIDLGDVVWAHPLTTFRIPLWILAERSGGPDDPLVRRVADAALEPWTDRMPLAELRALLPAADRVSGLHRALSWRRLVEDVPLAAVQPAEYARAHVEWLLVATADDPYARATQD